MRALDARQIHEARRASDQRAAGKYEARHGLQAALVDRARAVHDALAAFERRTDRRMQLEALEFVVGRKMRIGVIEMNDEAGGDELLAEVVNERAAAGGTVERPPLAVHDEPRTVLRGRHLPQLLDPDAVLLRVDAVAQSVALH